MSESRTSDVDTAYEAVIDAIVTQKLAPSQKVSENILCDQFNISRSASRNLIERLIAKQFLVNVSARITQVAPLTLMDIKQNFALRKMLLPNVVALAAANADYTELTDLNDQITNHLPVKSDDEILAVLKLNKALNLSLCEQAQYPLMIDWIRQLEDMAMRIYWIYIKINGGFPYSTEQQSVIFNVMRRDEPTRIREIMLQTLDQTEERILNTVFSHGQLQKQDLHF